MCAPTATCSCPRTWWRRWRTLGWSPASPQATSRAGRRRLAVLSSILLHAWLALFGTDTACVVCSGWRRRCWRTTSTRFPTTTSAATSSATRSSPGSCCASAAPTVML
eukprot:106895-Rhodomonas_salina.2